MVGIVIVCVSFGLYRRTSFHGYIITGFCIVIMGHLSRLLRSFKEHTLSFAFWGGREYSEQRIRRKRKCMERDSDRIALLASCRLKRGRCFLWQPIPYQLNL